MITDDPMRPPTSSACGISCGPQQDPGCECAFRIRRHDTAPRMEIDVRLPGGEPADLADWTATANLFWLAYLAADIDNQPTTTIVPLSAIDSVALADVLRFEQVASPRELADVLSVDAVGWTVGVTRGFQGSPIAAHVAGECVVGMRATGIPVDIVPITVPSSGVGQFGDGACNVTGPSSGDPTSETLTATKLVVLWRPEDTAASGRLLLQVVLEGPPGSGLRMTLPRNCAGYRVDVTLDSDDL